MNERAERARELHRSAPVADAHNDLLMSVVQRPAGQWGAYFREHWLPQLQTGGIGLQVLPIFVETEHRSETALRDTLRTIEAAHRSAEATADRARLCLTADDVREAERSGHIALVLALESMPGIDADVELIETLFRLGVRIASLTHLGRTPLGDGSEEDAAGSRLTSVGVHAVAEMNRTGMIVDVSHLGARGVEHVLEITSRPVIATHSGARARYDHHRNLTDEHLRAIAANDGIVCLNFYGGFLDDHEPTLDQLIDHAEHIRDIVGIERIGIGADFVEEVLADVTAPCCADGLLQDRYIAGLERPDGMPFFTEGLLRRGWSEEDALAMLGGNLRRFLARELPDNVR